MKDKISIWLSRRKANYQAHIRESNKPAVDAQLNDACCERELWAIRNYQPHQITKPEEQSKTKCHLCDDTYAHLQTLAIFADRTMFNILEENQIGMNEAIVPAQFVVFAGFDKMLDELKEQIWQIRKNFPIAANGDEQKKKSNIMYYLNPILVNWTGQTDILRKIRQICNPFRCQDKCYAPIAKEYLEDSSILAAAVDRTGSKLTKDRVSESEAEIIFNELMEAIQTSGKRLISKMASCQFDLLCNLVSS